MVSTTLHYSHPWGCTLGQRWGLPHRLAQCEAGLSADMQRERVPPHGRKRKTLLETVNRITFVCQWDVTMCELSVLQRPNDAANGCCDWLWVAMTTEFVDCCLRIWSRPTSLWRVTAHSRFLTLVLLAQPAPASWWRRTSWHATTERQKSSSAWDTVITVQYIHLSSSQYSRFTSFFRDTIFVIGGVRKVTVAPLSRKKSHLTDEHIQVLLLCVAMLHSRQLHWM